MVGVSSYDAKTFTSAVPPPSKEDCPVPLDNRASIKDYLLAREYTLDTTRYLREAANKYKECWWGFTGGFILILILYFVPYVGPIIAWPLYYGFFIATAQSVRSRRPVQTLHLLNGFLFYWPLLLIGIIITLIISLGLVCFVVPGLWAMVAFTFTPFIFLEYRGSGITVLDSLEISYKMVNKNFWVVLGYLVLATLFGLFGFFLFFIGFIITFPISYISMVYAFDDMFGLNPSPQIASACVYC